MQMNYNKESKDLDVLIEKFNYATNLLNSTMSELLNVENSV